ncbi:MAG: glycosyltransferase family 4 protein [Deltaproteobacteria bacterium]|nr:glycosyltransferase family 4 protein [Deltaproteobacteria bacterium]
MTGTIYYLCPDFAPPSAGTRRLYRHVFHLNRLGFNAAILHRKRGFVLSWHGYKVPVLWLEDSPKVQREDVLVFPEGMAALMKQTKDLPCLRIAIALNWAYIYINLPMGEDWKDYGITRAITPSPLIKDFLEWSMGLKVTLIGNYVDTTRYHYDPKRKKNRICYTARKDLPGAILNSIFSKREEIAGKYDWIRLEDMEEEEYARHLVESRIFLAASTQEGMPTSILEAMASGCLVLGFSGIGGNDYMVGSGRNRNCILVENGNLPKLGKALESLLSDLERDEGAYDAMLKNGIETASRFRDLEKEGESLRDFFLSLGVTPRADSHDPILGAVS